MIRPRYALQLARTKLRSKRGVLAASIVVSSILFAALIAAVIVFTGIQKSAVRFVEAANNNQYLVSVTPNIPHSVTGFYDEDSANLLKHLKRSITKLKKPNTQPQKSSTMQPLK
jgi:predicted PurR-regulated permease PerM